MNHISINLVKITKRCEGTQKTINFFDNEIRKN